MTRPLTPEAFVESCRNCRPTKHLHGWTARELGAMVERLMDDAAALRRVAEAAETWRKARARFFAAHEAWALDDSAIGSDRRRELFAAMKDADVERTNTARALDAAAGREVGRG